MLPSARPAASTLAPVIDHAVPDMHALLQPDKPEDVRVEVSACVFSKTLLAPVPGPVFERYSQLLGKQALLLPQQQAPPRPAAASTRGRLCCCAQAWYMDDSDADQRLPHRLSPNQPCPLEALGELGILAYRLNADVEPDADPRLQAIRKVRGYTYHVRVATRYSTAAGSMLGCCPMRGAWGGAGRGSNSGKNHPALPAPAGAAGPGDCAPRHAAQL